jgi:hypothetical protein
MQIVTSSWFTKLPDGHVRIGISRGVPGGATNFKLYRALQPGPWFKDGLAPQEFMMRYFEEVLSPLDPVSVVEDLAYLADGGVAVLVCWEPPPPSTKWCHRSFVSAWLHDALDLEVPELGHEGFGWDHPLMPKADLRRASPQ